MTKFINLRDRKESYELLKQLYMDNDKVNDDEEDRSAERESRTKSLGKISELPPCS
jgi:hypothetical protein